MRLKIRLILSFAFLNALLPSFSQAAINCNTLLDDLFHQRPQALALSAESSRIDGEQFLAGHVLKSQESLPSLKDGSYLYIIDQDGTLVFASRVDVSNEAEPLISHRALYQKLKLTKKAEPEILAAGEFEIHQGHNSLLNNKSGSWRGGAENLEWAEKVLKRHGLKVEPHTERIDLASERIAGKHNSELMGAQAWLRVSNSPLQKTVTKIRQAEAALLPYYPSNIPGKVDWLKFLVSPEAKLRKVPHLPVMEFYKQDWMHLNHLMGKTADYTEFPIELEHMVKTLGDAKTNELIERIFELEGVLNK